GRIELMMSNRFLHRGIVGARGRLAVSVLAAGFACAAVAQQEVPFRGGIPVAPEGLADLALGDGPFEFPTGEGQDIRVVALTKSLEFPYAIEFLPDDTILVTER